MADRRSTFRNSGGGDAGSAAKPSMPDRSKITVIDLLLALKHVTEMFHVKRLRGWHILRLFVEEHGALGTGLRAMDSHDTAEGAWKHGVFFPS